MQFRIIARILVAAAKHPAFTRLLIRFYNRLPVQNLTEQQRLHMHFHRIEYQVALDRLTGEKRAAFIAHHDRFAVQQHIISAIALRRRYNDYRYL